MAKSKTETTSKKKAKLPERDPQKRTRTGIFDNLRQLPHPVEEILGLTAPANQSAADSVTAPASWTAPATIDAQPRPLAAPVNKTAAAKLSGAAKQSGALDLAKLLPDAVVSDRWTAIPNAVSDVLQPLLKPQDYSVLTRLYRLTQGFRSTRCQVSNIRLAKACNVSERELRRILSRLEGHKLITRVGIDLSNTNQTDRGLIVQVNLPTVLREAPANQSGADNLAAPATETGADCVAPIKDKELNKPTHKQPQQPAVQTQPVGVGGSRFSLEECRRFADHLHETAQGITNPGGYAVTIFRSGHADPFIEAYFKPAPKLDFSKCPDCSGTGYRVLERDGVSGAKKCAHEGLHSP